MKITHLANPRQVILVTSRYQERDNVMTVAWHTPLSFEPMIYAISIGKKAFSLELVRGSGVFVINFMSKDFEKEVLFCGRRSGREIDKFEATGLEKEQALAIDCPRIKQALAFLECQVEKEIEVGDHFLFVAKVLKAELKETQKRLFHLYKDRFTTTVE